MKNTGSPAHPEPMVIGRVTRVLFGLAVFVLIAVVGPASLTVWGTIGLGVLGLSFLVGGITGNPGCEITAIPNLFLQRRGRAYCP